jgi:hypothetical protein
MAYEYIEEAGGNTWIGVVPCDLKTPKRREVGVKAAAA